MKNVRATAAVLAALMLPLCAAALPGRAYAVTQDEIAAIQRQKDALSQEAKTSLERLNALKGQQYGILEQKAALEEQSRLAQEQIELTQAQIDAYDDMIAEKAEEVDEAKSREELQLRKYRSRVRAMEENGGIELLALVTKSTDISELLTAVDDMGVIMQSDRVLEDQYIAAREETEKVKADYEKVKSGYEEKQKDLRTEQEELLRQVSDAEKQLDSLAEEIEKATKEYEAARAAENAAAAEISNLIAEYDRQKEAGNNSGSGNNGQDGGNNITGTGSLIWPVPCSMRVTSRYGNRADPFTGQTTYHAGIDIDGFGNDGQPIVAADSGTVIVASSNSGYGNYVIIDHGGMKTVYAHMSGFAVSAGQSVTQGQTVGYLGASGRATGTHCHFEVYAGDSRADPASYFSGISYYNC